MAAALFLIAACAVVYGFAVGVALGISVLGPMLLIAACGWLFLANPHVEVDDWHVRVVNPLATFVVSLGSLRDLRTRWALTLYTDAGSVAAWSAPAPGGRAMLTGTDEPAARSVPRSAIRFDSTVRPGDVPGTDSGDAAAAIRGRWEVARASGALDGQPSEPIRREWNIASLGFVLLSVIMTAASVVW